ncbi:MAG: LuxR family transcriptional regulator [Alphaproteobacteria bacterium]
MELAGWHVEEIQAFEREGAGVDLRGLVQGLRDRLGLTNIVYHSPVMPSHSFHDPYLLLTYSEEWVAHYKGQDYVQVDPVFNFGVRSLLPLDWAGLPKRSPRVVQMFAEARDAGVGHQGLTVPVRGPAQGLWALVSFTSGDNDRAWRDRKPELARDAVLAANYLHLKVAESFGPNPLADLDAISPREVEALAWAAEGKTTEDIAVLMRVSPETVKAHLDSARHKLGALNRPHAVAKALRSGIIR